MNSGQRLLWRPTAPRRRLSRIPEFECATGGWRMWSSARLAGPLILRPLREDAARTALTILSIALGVAVVIAIELAGDAATGSFQSSLQALTGKTDFEILANGGVDERVMATLTALPIDAKFAPLLEVQTVMPGIGSIPLYGADLAAAPLEVLASRPLADRLHSDRAIFNAAGRTLSYKITRTIEGAGEFLVLDIAEAQRALGRYGKLDRVDVTIAPHEDPAAAEAAIRRALPPAYLIERPGARAEENQRMLRAFRWNLRVLSYISLVVGAFLIYNTISVSVVRRRAE